MNESVYFAAHYAVTRVIITLQIVAPLQELPFMVIIVILKINLGKINEYSHL